MWQEKYMSLALTLNPCALIWFPKITADPHFLVYIYIYIYSHPQTDCFVLSELFRVARHAGRLKPGSIPVQLYVRLCFRPLVHQVDHVGKGNFKVFFIFRNSSSSLCLHFLYPIDYQSAQFFRRALHYASGSRQFLRQRAQPPSGSIYCHPQTDCFVLSELFSVQFVCGWQYIYVCACARVCVCVCVCVFNWYIKMYPDKRKLKKKPKIIKTWVCRTCQSNII